MNISTEVQCIIMHEGKVLIGRPEEGAKWVTPGGEINVGEHILEATIRTVFNCAGISVQPQNVIFVSEEIDHEKEVHRILIFLYAKYVEGEITISDDGLWSDAKWVDVRELGPIQDEMSNATVDGFYKFSIILQQSAARSGAQA